MHSQINFGYPWIINYGHLLLALPFLALLVLGWKRRWNRAALAIIGLITIWAFSAWMMVRFGFDMNGRATMPQTAFLRSGSGRVLDMGAGTGRSTIMVLEARPQTTVVALDLFGESFQEHFGNIETAQERLKRNLAAAGVAGRVNIQPGDMTHMPLASESFDGIVSAYAIDHLNRQGIGEALGEAHRVLKPGGEFLLLVIAKDRWLSYTFGPLLAHAHMVAGDFWADRLRDAGFAIVEEGTQPATRYILARRI